MAMEKKTLLAIYSRKSKFTGKGESIENQIELCRQYIKLHYGEREADSCLIYEDEGFSGGNLERPQFKKMLSDGRAGRIQAIIVYRLDRISRNIGDFARLIENLNEQKISFVSIKEQFDTFSPMGRAMMYIASVFSQLERETIAERIRDNMQELAKTGRWLGGVTPTGYTSEHIEKITIDGKVKKSCQLKLRQEEAQVIKAIFTLFLESGSLTDTQHSIRELGYRTKNGNLFTRFALKDILTNPVYMAADKAAYDYFTGQGANMFCREQLFSGQFGMMVYNRTLQKQGMANSVRELSEWIIAVGSHKWLVSGKDWIEAQQLLEKNKRPGGKMTSKNESALSGILYCGACKYCMRAKLSGSGNPGKERRFSYLCTGKEKNGSDFCCMKNINGLILDNEISDAVRNFDEDEKTFYGRINRLQKELFCNSSTSLSKSGLYRRQLTQTKEEIKNLAAILASPQEEHLKYYILEQMKELCEKEKLLLYKLSQGGEKEGGGKIPEEEIEQIGKSLSSFKETFVYLDREERKMLIKELVKRVIWDGDNAHVYISEIDLN